MFHCWKRIITAPRRSRWDVQEGLGDVLGTRQPIAEADRRGLKGAVCSSTKTPDASLPPAAWVEVTQENRLVTADPGFLGLIVFAN